MAKHAEFEVGDTVLAKQKGFPAWPAVIVENSDVPQNVLAAKPRRKNVYPVLFYGENNFMWANDADLKLLTVAEAKKNAKVPKTSRKLKSAYKVAIDRPHYKDYIAQAFGVPEEADDEEEQEEEEEPVAETRRTRTKAKRAAEKVPAKPARASRTSTARAAANTTSTRKRPAPAKQATTPSKKRKAVVVEESAEDEDYEEDQDADDIEEAEAEEELDVMETDSSDAQATPSKKRRRAESKEPLQTTEERLKLFKEVRLLLQEELLAKSRPESKAIPKVSEALKSIESVENIEISIVRQSKVNRVLYMVVYKVKDIPQDSRYHIRSRAEKLLENWNTPAEPIIRGIPEELAVKEETEDVSAMQSSRDVSLAPSDIATPGELGAEEHPEEHEEKPETSTQEPSSETNSQAAAETESKETKDEPAEEAAPEAHSEPTEATEAEPTEAEPAEAEPDSSEGKPTEVPAPSE